MKSNIFIPKQIKVGFQNREDTYTKKLAYIIYYDEKKKLRKETSWNNWRDDKIEPKDFENVPMEGFVLNKKVGDYCSDWNHRQAYVRVYDPRDFEFEITIENLLYILENASSIKGKGLEGQFIYGWDGKDLILMPVEAPDYKGIIEYNKIVFENKSIRAKDLIIGATYKTKKDDNLIYLGKYNYYGYNGEDKGKYFWFYDREASYCNFIEMKTISKNKFINVVDSNCCRDYAELFDKLECYYHYSPIDNSKDKYVNYTLDYFKKLINEKFKEDYYWWEKLKVYSNLEDNKKIQITIRRCNRENENLLQATKKSKKIEQYNDYWYGQRSREIEYDEELIQSENIEEIFNKIKPQYKNIYLKNGKLNGGIINNE